MEPHAVSLDRSSCASTVFQTDVSRQWPRCTETEIYFSLCVLSYKELVGNSERVTDRAAMADGESRGSWTISFWGYKTNHKFDYHLDSVNLIIQGIF